MKPVIDLSKEYGLLFDGGGARGAYQVGAWKALVEAGVKIKAVAGTSVGALNGALVCMGDVERAEKIWKEMTFSTVMDVDDNEMKDLFNRELPVKEFLGRAWQKIKDGGIDITPLRNLIHELIDEKAIRESGMEFCLSTFSLTDFKEMDLGVEDIPEGQLEDFLLASAYLIGFKNVPLHGKKYVDGGVTNAAPFNTLLDRNYKDLIAVRIRGIGVEQKVKFPEDAVVHEISPKEKLGSIIEFSTERSCHNLTLGYYDAKRMLYGLEGQNYYIKQTHSEDYYKKLLGDMKELEKAEYALTLKLALGFSSKNLYMGLLEAAAKLFLIPKYEIYTVDQLFEMVYKKYMKLKEEIELPKYVHTLAGLGEE